MSFLTTATRMWLTKSFKPFHFTNKYDSKFFYDDCNNLGLYIHIPFCKSLCSFCPYCKEIYNMGKCNEYIDHLIQEIEMVGKFQDDKKQVTSLYFGGGSPALVVDRIGDILNTLEKYFIITEGIGIELHPSDMDILTLQKLENSGITKISIGMQSFGEKFLKTLGRSNLDIEKIEKSLNAVSFETVSMDFIFALPDQTIEDLKLDIETAFKIGANHIAIYPFIDFSFTDSSIKILGKKEKKSFLDDITIYCKNKGYVRKSIWTFAKNGSESYSSMTRDNFIGFGCSATTLLKDRFKINTFSVEEYNKRIDENKLATSLTIKFTKKQRMLYYLFWTSYSTKVNKENFQSFFGIPLKKAYGFELWLARMLGFITETDEIYEMTLKGAFYYHYYENFYTLSYIDKMWGIMKKESFPNELKF